MAYAILGTPVPQFLDSSGDPYVAGTITIQDPTDDSVKASYPTAADADAATNGTSGDITLDAEGKPTATQLWGISGEDYKIIIKDSAGATVDTITDIQLAPAPISTLTTFGSGDATPTVAGGKIFRMNNTDITDFDDGIVGQTIKIYGAATALQVISSGTIITKTSFDAEVGAGDTIEFTMFTDQTWWETARSHNTAGSTTELVQAFTNTLGDEETNKTFFLTLAGGGSTIIPSVASSRGRKLTFIVAVQPTTAYTIDTASGENVLYGTISDIVGETVYGAAQDIISFIASTSVVGDRVDLECDGTRWFYRAVSGANGGMTTGQT